MSQRNIAFLNLWMLLFAGCAGTSLYYPYRIVTDNCNCEQYRLHDNKNKIEYLFKANYEMEHGISTNIIVEFTNSSRDTLNLGLGAVKVSSRNVRYQYNDKFIPLPSLKISPAHSDVVILTGKEITEENDWNKIAGEQLTLTFQGIRLGEQILPQQIVIFTPENPKIGK